MQLFQKNFVRYEGVRNINIYLLRFLYTLIFLFLSKDSWTYILHHQGQWDPMEAVVWSVWASFGALCFLGIIYPLKMIPILLLEIFYKVIWLVIVAYPLWSQNQLIGSPAEGITYPFLGVILPIVMMPWRYVFMHYILNRKLTA